MHVLNMMAIYQCKVRVYIKMCMIITINGNMYLNANLTINAHNKL